jgi:hypothetical protein
MDNYEGAFESGAAAPAEDSLAKSMEQYTASIPSSAFLSVAVGAMVLSLACQLKVYHPRMFLSGVQSEFAWIPAKSMRE